MRDELRGKRGARSQCRCAAMNKNEYGYGLSRFISTLAENHFFLATKSREDPLRKRTQKRMTDKIDAAWAVFERNPVCPNPFNFYSTSDLWGGIFSNFFLAPFTCKGVVFPTSEHFFQHFKMASPDDKKLILQTENCVDMCKIARDRSRPIIAGWDSVRHAAVEDALLLKFLTHEKLLAMLMATGTSTLVEHTKNDSYWGDAGDGTGGQSSWKDADEAS